MKIKLIAIKFRLVKYVVLLLTAGALLASCSKKSEETKEEEHHDPEGVVELTATQVEATQIMFGNFERKNLSEVITANGYTKSPPQNQADVSVFMSGIVRTISVIEGQYVKKGQIIATFQSLEFNNIRLEKAKLTEELLSEKANQDFLELEFARQKELSEQNVTAKKGFQKVSSELQAVTDKIKITKEQIDILDQNLRMGGNANTSVLAITAPISGYITDVKVKIGSSISANSVLFSIVDNSKIHVDLLVYEKDLFKIKEGQNVRFILTNQSNQEILGKIFSVGKAFQNETKSVAVHADINNKNSGLIPGMYVNALIDIGKNDVNTLPVEAVVKSGGKEFIFVSFEDEHEKEKGNFHFKRIEVKTGTTQLGFVQVTPLEELPEGTKIVIKGTFYLQSTMDSAVGGEEHSH